MLIINSNIIDIHTIYVCLYGEILVSLGNSFLEDMFERNEENSDFSRNIFKVEMICTYICTYVNIFIII